MRVDILHDALNKLINNGVITQNEQSDWIFHPEKFPQKYDIVHNGMSKMMLLIKSFFEQRSARQAETVLMKYGIPFEVYIDAVAVIKDGFSSDCGERYRDLLIGRVNPKTAREKLISRAGGDPRIAINILANIEKEHPLAQEIFRHYQNQNRSDSESRFILRGKMDF